MITKEQIEDYILRNSPVASEKHVEKAILWAISQMQAENNRLTQALSRAGYANARLREALAAITAQIAQAKEALAK